MMTLPGPHSIVIGCLPCFVLILQLGGLTYVDEWLCAVPMSLIYCGTSKLSTFPISTVLNLPPEHS
jgi:hypothetical protein